MDVMLAQAGPVHERPTTSLSIEKKHVGEECGDAGDYRPVGNPLSLGEGLVLLV